MRSHAMLRHHAATVYELELVRYTMNQQILGVRVRLDDHFDTFISNVYLGP